MFIMAYSPGFKESIVKRVLQSNDPQKLIARNAGIGYSTLQKWLRQYHQQFDLNMSPKEKRPQDWSAEERLNALIETAPMEPEEKATWCRQKGVYSHQLDQWRKDMLAGKSVKESTQSRAEAKKLRTENTALKKELRRKDKALAETSALLVLKKKAHLIWGDDEDN